MKKSLYALALAAALAAAGCGVTPPPKPSLSSTDRNERLKAVKDAENRFGACQGNDASGTRK